MGKRFKKCLKKNYQYAARWLIVLVGIFLMIVFAPFGFWFPAVSWVTVVRELVIAIAVVLFLYLLRPRKK